MKIIMILIKTFFGEGEDEEVKSASLSIFLGEKVGFVGKQK